MVKAKQAAAVTAPVVDSGSIERAKMEHRLKALTKERDDFLRQANQRVAALNGAIQVLEDLLGLPSSFELPPPAEGNGEAPQQESENDNG